MGLFKKRATDPTEIERLKSEIAAMGARLDAADSHKDQLGAQVHGLASRLDTATSAPPPVVTTPVVAFEPAELDKMRALIQRVSDRVTDLDGRVTSISTELANQLNEISGDLDQRPVGAPAEPIDTSFVDVLREAQTRLANEQARFQIAFRHDLAELADRFTRQQQSAGVAAPATGWSGEPEFMMTSPDPAAHDDGHDADDGGSTAGNDALRTVDLGDVDLGDDDLGDVDLGSADLGDVDLGDAGLRDVDLGDVDLGDIDLDGPGSESELDETASGDAGDVAVAPSAFPAPTAVTEPPVSGSFPAPDADPVG